MDKVTDNSPDVESTESTEGSFPTVGVDTGDTITATLATGTENVGGGGGAFGGASESSAAIHATAKWSTAQLKKHQAEQAARAAAAEAALAKAKSQRDALTQRLKDIVNDALRANAARSPSVTDLAHANNMAMQAEAERLRLAKAEQKAREEAEAAEKALREAERQRDEIARQQAETAHLLAMAEAAEAEKNRQDSLDEEHRAVEVAEKKLAEAKAELAKAESDVQSKQAIVSRVAGELENAQKSVDVKVTGFPGWRDVQKKLERQLQDKKNEYSSVTNALNSAVSIRDAKKTDVQNAEIKLKEAKDALEKSQVKDSVDTMVGFYQYITEQYGEKYSRIAQDLAEKAKGNKFSSVDEALAAFEEYQNVLNKKFSAADRNDIFNALESVNYDEWAKHLEKISKSLKVTGYLSSGYDIVSELLKAKDTGDWKPLFLVIEKQAVDIGIGYVVAVVFSLITGAPLGIFSVAIVTAILCSYLDKDVLNKLNESLGI